MERRNMMGVYVLLAAILVVTVGGAAVGGVMISKMNKMGKTITKLEEANAEEKTKEDDVVIADQYTIKSTKQISDAYKAGDDKDLSKADKETMQMAKKVLDEVTDEKMSDYEKELAVYEWMVKNIKSGSNSLLASNQTPEAVSTPHGVLKGHNAVCVGYATTFRLFMQMMDIDCKVVHNKEAYHSWDEVKLDDDWYYVDVYSDAGSGSASYANFNMTDDMAASGHDWDRSFWPSAVGTKYNYAILNAKECNDIFKIPAKIRKSLEKGGEALFLNIGKDEEGKKEALLSSMYENFQGLIGEYGDITFALQEADNEDQILTISFTNYSEQNDQSGEISDKDAEKLSKAISKAMDGYSGEGMTDGNGSKDTEYSETTGAGPENAK